VQRGSTATQLDPPGCDRRGALRGTLEAWHEARGQAWDNLAAMDELPRKDAMALARTTCCFNHTSAGCSSGTFGHTVQLNETQQRVQQEHAEAERAPRGAYPK
jgi:hypothetical protein